MIHLITYADNNFILAAKLLMSEARALNIFDRIHCYTPREIKRFLNDKWISQYTRGGGYWIWKPYIALQELEKMHDGDILIYVDAGCSLIKSKTWGRYLEILKKSDAIFMHFNTAINYGWTPTVRCWTKKSAIDYFALSDSQMGWLDKPQFITGCFLLRKCSATLNFIKRWSDFMCQHQELVIDAMGDELNKQDPFFCEHRHDQAILSLLLYTLKDNYNFLFLPEEIEWHYNSDDSKRAIIAARRNNKWVRANKKFFLRKLVKNRLISIKNRACR